MTDTFPNDLKRDDVMTDGTTGSSELILRADTVLITMTAWWLITGAVHGDTDPALPVIEAWLFWLMMTLPTSYHWLLPVLLFWYDMIRRDSSVILLTIDSSINDVVVNDLVYYCAIDIGSII